jgi:hypothetical protein
VRAHRQNPGNNERFGIFASGGRAVDFPAAAVIAGATYFTFGAARVTGRRASGTTCRKPSLGGHRNGLCACWELSGLVVVLVALRCRQSPRVLSRMIQSARFRFRPARYRQQAARGGRAPEACSGRTGGRTTEAYSTGAGGGSRQASAGGVHPDSIAVSVSVEPGPAVSEHPGPMATVPNLGMSRFLVFQRLQI